MFILSAWPLPLIIPEVSAIEMQRASSRIIWLANSMGHRSTRRKRMDLDQIERRSQWIRGSSLLSEIPPCLFEVRGGRLTIIIQTVTGGTIMSDSHLHWYWIAQSLVRQRDSPMISVSTITEMDLIWDMDAYRNSLKKNRLMTSYSRIRNPVDAWTWNPFEIWSVRDWNTCNGRKGCE
jgi:hypothetical protein